LLSYTFLLVLVVPTKFCEIGVILYVRISSRLKEMSKMVLASYPFSFRKKVSQQQVQVAVQTPNLNVMTANKLQFLHNQIT
jgi:hypothetical protein